MAFSPEQMAEFDEMYRAEHDFGKDEDLDVASGLFNGVISYFRFVEQLEFPFVKDLDAKYAAERDNYDEFLAYSDECEREEVYYPQFLGALREVLNGLEGLTEKRLGRLSRDIRPLQESLEAKNCRVGGIFGAKSLVFDDEVPF